jgi:hypothetical protein
MAARMRAQHFHGPRANAAGRQVHDALERCVVVTVRNQPQVGERVLDFLAFEESQAAVHTVRNARGEQVFLEHARLCVRAVQDGVVTPVAAARNPFADLVDDEFGLVALVIAAVQPDGRARAVAGPQLLADAAAVVRDHGVGRGEDVARGAIILLEAEQLHVAIVLAVLLQVFDFRTAPAVDRLVVVADDVGDAGRTRQHPHPFVLHGIGVLELVDEHVSETRPIVLAESRCFPQDLAAAQQQLRKVDHAVATTGLLVRLVQPEHLPPRRIAVVLEVLGSQALVLLLVDEPRDLARHPARVVEVQATDDLLDQSLLILAVEDLESLRQARLAPVQSQQAVRYAVERADPERSGRQAELRLDPVPHLGGRLVRKRDGEDAVRGDTLDLDEPLDPVRQHARLATARTCKHERG